MGNDRVARRWMALLDAPEPCGRCGACAVEGAAICLIASEARQDGTVVPATRALRERRIEGGACRDWRAPSTAMMATVEALLRGEPVEAAVEREAVGDAPTAPPMTVAFVVPDRLRNALARGARGYFDIPCPWAPGGSLRLLFL